MSKPSKWFRARIRPPVALPAIVEDTTPTLDELADFLAMCEKFRTDKLDVLVKLAGMRLVHRLHRNCVVVINLLAEREIESVIPQGLLPNEQEALLFLARRGVSGDDQAIAQSLLHIQTRQQLVDTLKKSFDVAKR